MKKIIVEDNFLRGNWVKDTSKIIAQHRKTKCYSIHHTLRFFTQVWLRIIGIHLQLSPDISSVKRFQMSHRIFAFFWTLVIYIMLLINNYGNPEIVAAGFASDDRAGGVNTTSTFVWNIRIDYGSMAIRNVGIQTCVVFLMDKSFGKLIDSLDQTENHLAAIMGEQKYQRYGAKYRNYCFAGIAYILVAVTLLSVATGIEMTNEDQTLFRTVIEVNSIAVFVYPMSVLILFCLLCSIVSGQIRTIAKLAQKIPSNGGLDHQLKQLQIEHAHIFVSIHWMNRSFGPILFLEVSYIFISVTVSSVYVLVATISNRCWTIYFLILSIICVHFVNLILISCSVDNIKYQIRKLELVLFQMSHKYPNLQSQIISFAGQVSQLNPQITASGFFNIGKELLPTLIGTTLTYFFITCQFHWAEIGQN